MTTHGCDQTIPEFQKTSQSFDWLLKNLEKRKKGFLMGQSQHIMRLRNLVSVPFNPEPTLTDPCLSRNLNFDKQEENSCRYVSTVQINIKLARHPHFKINILLNCILFVLSEEVFFSP